MRLRTDDRSMALWGAVLWATGLVVIAVLVAIDPGKRTLLPLYHDAAARWWAGADLYAGPSGFNYLPQFALVFSPFHWMGVPAGDIVWRLASAAWLGLALRRLLVAIDAPAAGKHFFWASALLLPMCLGPLRNGQANAIFAAATVEAAIWLIRGRWWPAAMFLAMVVAIKPIGLAMLLLAPAVYRRAFLALAVALVALVAVPFLFAGPGYVLGQYQSFAHNLAACSVIAEDRFANIAGILRVLGFEPAGAPSTVLALCGAVAALGAWVIMGSRGAEPQRGLCLLALSTSYLMLFNPMNESNGYVIVAPAMAVLALRWLDQPGRRNQGWALLAIMLSIGIVPEMLRGFARDFSLWWKPLATMIFLALLVADALPRRAAGALPAEAADP